MGCIFGFRLSFSSSHTVGVDSVASTVEFEVTAYCRKECCCGKYADGITASGEPAIGNFVAASIEYPFYMMMEIDGYADGIAVPVLDRGGAIKGNRLDLFFDDLDGVTGHQRALNWGHKKVKVRVIK